jgi:hypothetical protein
MMAATTEKRLTELEARLDALQRLLEERLPSPLPIEPKKKRGWEAIVGTFSNDPHYEEAMRLGRQWRESKPEENSENLDRE